MTVRNDAAVRKEWRGQTASDVPAPWLLDVCRPLQLAEIMAWRNVDQ
jgi:hypothetical protein